MVVEVVVVCMRGSLHTAAYRGSDGDRPAGSALHHKVTVRKPASP